MGAHLPSSGSRRRSSRQRQGFTDINVTPFVDVMLVLLIVFMVTAPMLTAGVQVDLPDSSAPAVESKEETLSITIKRDGSIYIQETQVLEIDLITKLRAISKEKENTRIFVRGDSRVEYGDIMSIAGKLAEAGYTKVALITEQPSGKR
ncbi:MAG: protein TolR [Alphaproteobacteria bacterium]|nr:MAG: protein TolR [Alphaproteobacteria bacterium]